jgi:NAD(P)H-dependent nitrite reductase large subunit
MTPKQRLVVVGNGMAGARFVEDVLARGGGDRFHITVFGDEPCGNYNRILLSGVLAGSHRPDDIFLNPLSWYEKHGITLHAGVRAEAIVPAAKEVRGRNGRTEPYDILVIATGSRPIVPDLDGLPGGSRPGVFVFRTLGDCDRILGWAQNVSRAAVIGGGLLGLEAARGLLNAGVDVHVVHLMPHLMDTQLDPPAARVLQRTLEQIGVRFHLETATAAVLGRGRVTGLAFRDGSTIDCDMVVIAAGIRPNVELAAAAGLAVGRGILVGDDLGCRGAEQVYAIGECVEHRGRIYGLVAPVWEQAAILADRLTGRKPDALYTGSRLSTKLKVAGIDLAVMGEKDAVGEDDEVVSYAEPSRGIYKKLVVRDGRLAGAVIIGDGAIVPSLVHAFTESTPLADNRAELLFRIADAAPATPGAAPDTAQICNCNGVTKAQIIEAVLAGARSVSAVCESTRAATGCGSCRPEVEAVVALACQGLETPEVLAEPDASVTAGPRPDGMDGVVVTLNKIERIKRDKDGLDIVGQVPALARDGWQAIDEGDRERLKWAGVFFRRQTPGRFMMRVRISNGHTTAAQIRELAAIARDVGSGFVDVTTRQQIQLRDFEIGQVPEMWARLERVGLVSLQTGMDNIRNVVGCPVSGLTRHELFDASPIVRAFTEAFLRNPAYTNLPRKFNVGISACLEHCTPAESQDLALTPAVKTTDGGEVSGFNVMVGGKMGSGGFRVASPLDLFVAPSEAVAVCGRITEIFRDHGFRSSRTKARLAFLIDAWGIAAFRAELQRRCDWPLLAAGRDARGSSAADHLGIVKQRQSGLNYVGLAVPVGRITISQLDGIARLADEYGDGQIRLTTAQNVILPNVPDTRLKSLLQEPLLGEFRHDAPGVIRGLVSCTGIDYCHFALVETKELALKTARELEPRLPPGKLLTMHWSGCPAGCGNHAAADIGLLGKNAKVDGEIVDAVDVFVGGKSGPNARPGTKILEDVPCNLLPEVLERLIPYLGKRPRQIAPVPVHALEAPA